MSTATIERAHELRDEYPHMPAIRRLKWASSQLAYEPPAHLVELAEHDQTEYDGFTLALEVTHDDYPDGSWLGSFTNRWQPGAVRNPGSVGHYSREFKWFVPETTEDEHYRSLRDMKHGRAEAHELARSYVLRDMELAREYSPLLVIVTAHRAGVELARAVIGGVDDDEYARSVDILDDLVTEVLAEARTTLAELCQ